MNNSIYTCPEHYAQDIIKSFKLSPPIDLKKILDVLDIKVNYEPLNNIDALLIISSGKKNIILDNAEFNNPKRDRFTIAHELGHYMMPWHKNLQFYNKIDFGTNDKFECEANDFASELLVPEDYLMKDIEGEKVTLDLIKRLAEKYEVSLIVMARRILKYINEEAAVLIYYSNGKKYVQIKSRSFNGEIKDGKISNSLAHKMIQEYSNSAEAKQILDYNVWFKRDGNNYKVIEESMYQSRLNRAFTLLRKADAEDEVAMTWDY